MTRVSLVEMMLKHICSLVHKLNASKEIVASKFRKSFFSGGGFKDMKFKSTCRYCIFKTIYFGKKKGQNAVFVIRYSNALISVNFRCYFVANSIKVTNVWPIKKKITSVIMTFFVREIF